MDPHQAKQKSACFQIFINCKQNSDFTQHLCLNFLQQNVETFMPMINQREQNELLLKLWFVKMENDFKMWL